MNGCGGDASRFASSRVALSDSGATSSWSFSENLKWGLRAMITGIAADSPLQAAKELLSIHQLWGRLNLPGKPARSCRSPFREDRNPSFSIYDGGRKWKDHATGEGGDAADFVAVAFGISNEEACRKLIELAGVIPQVPHFTRRESESDDAKRSFRLELPALIPYSEELAQRVAKSRCLDTTAVEFAYHWLKTLVFAAVCETPSWILTDASRRSAEARRIDRKPYPATATLSQRKSHSLHGSSKSWPVGLLPPGFEEDWLRRHCHKILLVEGGPDYLAACQLIAESAENVLPVAMLGASATICQDALSYFAGKHVTVVGHPDEAGRAAVMRWAQQIKAAGGVVRSIQLKKGDLCDIVAAGATHNDLGLF